jgi:hypothetical protein
MSQENAETLVNDFLASFSTLYNEIPKVHRRDVLESVPLPAVLEDEQGNDSTSLGSGSDSDSDSRHSPLDFKLSIAGLGLKPCVLTESQRQRPKRMKSGRKGGRGWGSLDF